MTHSAVTDAEGRYRAPLLPSGDYEVRVTASGFQPLLRRGVSLAVGQDAIVDATLTIGQIETTVTVEGAATTVSTRLRGVERTGHQSGDHDLPLNGRSFQQLALLQTGVTRRWPPATIRSAGVRRDIDQRRAPGAEQFSARRHRLYQQRIQ